MVAELVALTTITSWSFSLWGKIVTIIVIVVVIIIIIIIIHPVASRLHDSDLTTAQEKKQKYGLTLSYQYNL